MADGVAIRLVGGPHDGYTNVYDLPWPAPETVWVVPTDFGIAIASDAGVALRVAGDDSKPREYRQTGRRSNLTDEQLQAMPVLVRGCEYEPVDG